MIGCFLDLSEIKFSGMRGITIKINGKTNKNVHFLYVPSFTRETTNHIRLALQKAVTATALCYYLKVITILSDIWLPQIPPWTRDGVYICRISRYMSWKIYLICKYINDQVHTVIYCVSAWTQLTQLKKRDTNYFQYLL